MTIQSKDEQIESNLRALEAAGFDVKALWREHAERVRTSDRGTPGEDDVRYVLPSAQPVIAQHLADGTNQSLAVEALWDGYSYTLTPGQRGILRDRYGLTPTQTVTVTLVEPWPGTMHPRRIRLRSDVHVDPRNRRHVLSEVVISDVGTFFKLASERDAELRDDGSLSIEKTLVLGDIAKLKSEERWAVEDLCGVKVESKVEVVKSSDTHFTVVCLKTGNKATVPRSEFFAKSAEYVEMNAKTLGTRKRAKAFDATPVLDSLIAEMLKDVK